MGAVNHQLGFAEETTWATAVTPDRFVEFTSESLERRQQVAVSEGIREGRRIRGAGRRITRNDAGGTVNFEVATSGFGLFFEHLLGAVSTVEDEVGVAWTHTFTPGTLTGKGLTLQKGVDTPSGTVEPFTYPGAKIVSGVFSIDQDGLLMLALTFDAEQEETATALATASYTTPTIFTYSEGSLEVDDVVKANVRSVGSLSYTNNLQTDRYFLGSSGLKGEPINTPFDDLAGNLDVEFQNTTDFYDLFAADTAAKLELIFTGDNLPGSSTPAKLAITIADVRFEGETPKIGGPELVFPSIPFVGVDPTSGDAIEIAYTTSDENP